MVYLTLFNLFLFTLSMLSLICAVMSQKDSSGNSVAKLMDQFGLFCESISTSSFTTDVKWVESPNRGDL